MASEKKFAVLIDADNVSDKYIKIILDEVSNEGVATYKRIYGDWTRPELAAWKGVLLDNSIMPIQQYSYTTGKNATDSAMIIDALDILYSKQVDGFCIVSSDSDFTRLAARLRESGMQVLGMGEQKTPKPFISACNRFKYLDILAQVEEPEKPAKAAAAGKQPKPAEKSAPKGNKKAAAPASNLKTIRSAIRTIVVENSDEDNWISVAQLGNLLGKRYPDFDVRNFGFSKLTPFVESLGLFEGKSVSTGNDGSRAVYIRLK